MKRLFLLSIASLCALAIGCAALQKNLNSADPADSGNVPAQVATVVHNATTQPVVEDVASTVPWGTVVLSGISALSLIAAGYFKQKQASAQAHLDTAQAATGTASNAAATAALVNNLDTTAIPPPTAPAAPAPQAGPQNAPKS